MERRGRHPEIAPLHFLEVFSDKPESSQGRSGVEGREGIYLGENREARAQLLCQEDGSCGLKALGCRTLQHLGSQIWSRKSGTSFSATSH